jgi:exopolysaccharide biosynthesis predicted pyruvyltransferase EpsI
MSHELLSPLALLQSLEEHLATLKGVPIYNIPLATSTGRLVGNNGDDLIRLGAERLFERCELTFVHHPADAQVLMMGGSGGMLEKYRFIPGLFRHYWTRFPDKPLWVLPSTYYFPNRSLTLGLPSRTAEVVLYCRERVSYEHLRRDGKLPSCCEIRLSHDTAFALADSPLVESYSQTPGQHILMVERDDMEHPARFNAPRTGAESWRTRIPDFLKKPLYPLRAFFFSQRTTPFRGRCEAIISERHPDLRNCKRLFRDVSRRDFNTLEQFCQTIASAELVLTTRLHAAIFAALLGKTTYVFAGRHYHKIRAIYEHSLSDFEHVNLIAWEDA